MSPAPLVNYNGAIRQDFVDFLFLRWNHPPPSQKSPKIQLEWSNGAETLGITSTNEYKNLVEYEVDPSTLTGLKTIFI